MNKLAKKRRWVLVPCPDYDVEAMESWLEDQAKHGLFLSKEDGFFLGFACFDVGAPKAVRYRLEAKPKESFLSAFDENKAAAVHLSEEMGWEFVTERQEFLIYRCDNTHLPELNTDPAVQALSLKRVQRAALDRFWTTCYWLFIYPLLYFLSRTPVLLLSILTVGTLRFLAILAITVFQAVNAFRDWARLRKLRRHLRSGGRIEHTNGWRDGAKRCMARKIVEPLLTVFWLVLIVSFVAKPKDGAILQPQEANALPVPTASSFLTLPSGETDGRHTLRGETRTDLLASEIASLHEEDSGYVYNADYYALRAPWLAKQLALELRHYDEGPNFRLFSKHVYEITPIDLPELDADTVFCYRGQYGDYRVIVQKGGCLISVKLWLFGGVDFPAEAVAEALSGAIS